MLFIYTKKIPNVAFPSLHKTNNFVSKFFKFYRRILLDRRELWIHFYRRVNKQVKAHLLTYGSCGEKLFKFRVSLFLGGGVGEKGHTIEKVHFERPSPVQSGLRRWSIPDLRGK